MMNYICMGAAENVNLENLCQGIKRTALIYWFHFTSLGCLEEAGYGLANVS